jgi:hypothetical protein
MFETHLTVRLPGQSGEGDGGLARWAAQHGMKYTEIQERLNRSPGRDQPANIGSWLAGVEYEQFDF